MKQHSYFPDKLSKDIYSAIIRFSLGLFIALYVWLGMSSGEFTLTHYQYNSFASFFFIMTIIFGLDIFRDPESHVRRYITLIFDFSCTSYAIILTGGGSSEFILIYIWLYIAYSTRYGSSYLFAALALVLVQYNIILIMNNSWSTNILASSAQIFVLITMPLYLHSMLKQLRQAKREAELATRAKSSFLATMSHEIRTPMSGIIGTAYLLQKTEQNKEQKEYTNALLDAAKSLHALIDDILDFSKIEANKLHLQTSPFDMHHIINEVISVLSPNAENHSLDLIVYIDPKLPSLLIGDSQRVRQVLFNLLGNAIKFTDKGEVILKVTGVEPSAINNKPSAVNNEPSAVNNEPSAANNNASASLNTNNIALRFDIIDTGIGINKEQQKHIFDSFTQADNMQTQQFGGTGLGTTISKQLIELMGGEIGLSSVFGTGSHFWFTLNLAIEKSSDIKERYHQVFTDMRVALSICNNALYESLESYCQFFGFTVERFYSEAELFNGLQQAVSHGQPFDLVILSDKRDKNLPLQLAKQINTLDSAPKKIFLNYLNKRNDTHKLGGSLFDSYISKPVNYEQLGDELSALLKPDDIQTDKEKCCDLNNISLDILIAEDEDINAMVLSSFLQEAGHKTKRVLNGSQAVEELSQNHYDIAFMDMRMPEMGGIEATISWRDREPENKHIPIIALTANATKDDRQSCLEAGMDDFITKPITPEQLSAAIVKFYSPNN